MSSLWCRLYIIFSAYRTIIKAQPETRFYYFDFNGQSIWTIENQSIQTQATNSRCQTSPCWECLGGSSATASIAATDYHAMRIVIDVEETNLQKDEFCYLQYSSSALVTWTNANIIGKNDNVALNFEITIPDNNNYNGQSSLQIRIGTTGDSNNDKCYFDNIEIFGIPYTSHPTANPTHSPIPSPGDALIDPLNDNAFSGNDGGWGGNYEPRDARMNQNGWAPQDETGAWLQIDLGDDYIINSVETRGCASDSEWTTWFDLWYATEAEPGSAVYQGNLQANVDSNTPKTHDFQPNPIIGRYLRFVPTAANANGYTCMRVEAYGTTMAPTPAPTDIPTRSPTPAPTNIPTPAPTDIPTQSPTPAPTSFPTPAPTKTPTKNPTDIPSTSPTKMPTITPTKYPTLTPTENPTLAPTNIPTVTPTQIPTISPTPAPTNIPTRSPTFNPTNIPSQSPVPSPTKAPTPAPTNNPTPSPTSNPTQTTLSPTPSPTNNPTPAPTAIPTVSPTYNPTNDPSSDPTNDPTYIPTYNPTNIPTFDPTNDPSIDPTYIPTVHPTVHPTTVPTTNPTTPIPTPAPTDMPTPAPTTFPTPAPTPAPTTFPTPAPTTNPTPAPTDMPTPAPTDIPTISPTYNPTFNPTVHPTLDPTNDPSYDPTTDPTQYPTPAPTDDPTNAPTNSPVHSPTDNPTPAPTQIPTPSPVLVIPGPPTHMPTLFPTQSVTTSEFENTSDNLQMTETDGLMDNLTLVMVAVLAALFMVCLCIIVCIFWKKRKKSDGDQVNIAISSADYAKHNKHDREQIASMSPRSVNANEGFGTSMEMSPVVTVTSYGNDIETQLAPNNTIAGSADNIRNIGTDTDSDSDNDVLAAVDAIHVTAGGPSENAYEASSHDSDYDVMGGNDVIHVTAGGPEEDEDAKMDMLYVKKQNTVEFGRMIGDDVLAQSMVMDDIIDEMKDDKVYQSNKQSYFDDDAALNFIINDPGDQSQNHESDDDMSLLDGLDTLQ